MGGFFLAVLTIIFIMTFSIQLSDEWRKLGQTILLSAATFAVHIQETVFFLCFSVWCLEVRLGARAFPSPRHPLDIL